MGVNSGTISNYYNPMNNWKDIQILSIFINFPLEYSRERLLTLVLSHFSGLFLHAFETYGWRK